MSRVIGRECILRAGRQYQLRDGRVTSALLEDEGEGGLLKGHPFYCPKLDLRFTRHGLFRNGNFHSPNDIVAQVKRDTAA